MTKRLFPAALLACALAVPFPVLAQAQAEKPAPGEGENLTVPPLQGWAQAIGERKGKVIVLGYVPPGQTKDDWTESLTLQMVFDKPHPPVEQVLAQIKAGAEQGCEAVGAGAPAVAKVNGYDAGMVLIGCTKGKSDGLGLVALYKVITGKDATYVVRRNWRGPAFAQGSNPVSEAKIEEWKSFMTGVTLCDIRDPAHPCKE